MAGIVEPIPSAVRAGCVPFIGRTSIVPWGRERSFGFGMWTHVTCGAFVLYARSKDVPSWAAAIAGATVTFVSQLARGAHVWPWFCDHSRYPVVPGNTGPPR